jgi:hypothetical protein
MVAIKVIFASILCGVLVTAAGAKKLCEIRDCQYVYGNDGRQSCESYCAGINGGPWNGELPASWNGALCVTTTESTIGCNTWPSAEIMGLLVL